jgi:glycosyltransferase involved in cell wall biosynthesis
MRLGFFGARSDHTGLGNQWVNLARMLQPEHILLVDSTPFNGNAQHPDRYAGFNVTTVDGFPSSIEASQFLRSVDVVLCVETPYCHQLFQFARLQRKPAFLMVNPEFWDAFSSPTMPRPSVVLAPTPWLVPRIRQVVNRVVELPPPIFGEDFAKARKININRSGNPHRFVHIVGRPAVMDRNGTESLLNALTHSSGRYELVIKSQVPLNLATSDPRVTFECADVADQADLYAGYDLSIIPRRYGGLCIPMGESLACALPVIMTDISPNQDILPPEWLVPATVTGRLLTRTMLDVYSVDERALARKLDQWAAMPDEVLDQHKARALELSRQWDPEVLRPQYEAVFRQ